jgi:hypothetical protein
MIDARAAVEAIVARDGLQQLAPDDLERLIALYADVQPELAALRTADVSAAEPAVIFPAE